MPPAPQQKDARREHLRRNAIYRRQAVVDRVVATRILVVGGVVAVSCLLAGYLDANARTRTTSSATNAFSGAGYANTYGGSYGSNSGSYGESTQGLFGGGSAPSSSSGAGTAVSGGS